MLGASVEYGLDEPKVDKLTNILHQAGATNLNKAENICMFIFENNIFERPEDEILDELRKNKMI